MPDGDDRLVVVQPTPVQKTRHQIVGRGLRYYHYRQQILYSQARPTQLRLPRDTTRLDCSGLVAACMDFARVLPKVDWRYTNTWVQQKFGHAVDLAQARPGDVVFYGPKAGNPTHEALYLGRQGQLEAIDITPPPQLDDGKRWVLTMGHYPMQLQHVDYRSDRLQLRSFIR